MGEVYLEILQVNYKEKKLPHFYSLEAANAGGDVPEDILFVPEQMKRALEKPVLWTGDKFEEEYTD
jgi:hypothetical protein